jgi:hypothetical protein
MNGHAAQSGPIPGHFALSIDSCRVFARVCGAAESTGAGLFGAGTLLQRAFAAFGEPVELSDSRHLGGGQRASARAVHVHHVPSSSAGAGRSSMGRSFCWSIPPIATARRL